MAILKDLIVHGSSRFLNKIYASEIQTPLIDAEAGIFKKLKADDATVVGLLDVQGQMHTNSWTNSNIATIDGSFYIAPTLSSSSGTVSFSSATAATFTGTYSAISSLYIGNDTASTVQWTSGSKILITGEVEVDGEWTPLGTLLGILNSTNPTTSMPIVNITDNRNNTSNILTNIYSLKDNTSLNYRNLKISLYQRADNSQYYPLGIYITALGQNGKTFLDIYGGVNALTTSYGGYANPNVRIGNLSGLPAITTAAGNFTPVGWGIYTTNGYFSGTIVSNTGVIGGWKLGANSLYNETTGLNDNTEGIYLGTDGIRNYKDSTHFVTIQNGVINARGVNLTGQITATSGTIGGASITNGTLIIGNANINDINASKINAGDIAAARIQTNLISAINAKVNDLSALTATIGGFQIDSSSVHTNNVVVTSNADNSIALSSTDFTRTINSISRTGLRLAIGDKFGVTGDGTIYASDVDLTGNVVATSGSIGGVNIVDGNLDVSSINIGDLNGASNYALKTEITDAEKVATSYITYIDSTEGIKIHNISDQTNYLQLNSTAISMYRNNIETLNINNDEIRIGKINGNNVCVDNDSVDIRKGQTVLSSFGNNAVILGQRGKSRLVLSPTMISGVSNIGYKNFNIISGDSSEERTITKNGNFENESSETGVFNGSIRFSETFYYFHKITVTIIFNYVWDGEQKTESLTFDIDDPAEDETGNALLIGGALTNTSYNIEYRVTCTFQHDGEITLLYFNTNAELEPKNTSVSYEMGNTASYSIVIETKVYQNTSYTFGSRIVKSEYGNNSFAIGEGLIASSDNQIAIGKFNNDDPNKNYAFMIGNGAYGVSRSNAFAVDWDGNTEIAGDLEVTGNLMANNFGGNYLPSGRNINNLSKYDSGWWGYSRSNVSGTFPINDTYGTIGHIQGTSDNVAMQFLRSNSQAASNRTFFVRYKLAGTWGDWQQITSSTIAPMTINYTSNSYCTSNDVTAMYVYRKGGWLWLRGNLHVTNSVPVGTTAQIGTITGWVTPVSTYQNVVERTNKAALVVALSYDGKLSITNNSVAASNGYYNFCLIAPSTDGQ